MPLRSWRRGNRDLRTHAQAEVLKMETRNDASVRIRMPRKDLAQENTSCVDHGLPCPPHISTNLLPPGLDRVAFMAAIAHGTLVTRRPDAVSETSVEDTWLASADCMA